MQACMLAAATTTAFAWLRLRLRRIIMRVRLCFVRLPRLRLLAILPIRRHHLTVRRRVLRARRHLLRRYLCASS